MLDPQGNAYEVSWDLIEQDQFESYLITLSFDDTDLPLGTTLKVELKDSLADINDQAITENNLEIDLTEPEEEASEYTD